MVLEGIRIPTNSVTPKGKEAKMGDKGKRDKGKRELQKKSQLTPKEKRKQKKIKGKVNDFGN